MIKKVFEDVLIAGMQQEMQKQAAASRPSLVKAAECLHVALEIFEEVGLDKQANQILSLLQKIAIDHPATKSKPAQKLLPIQKLMEAGLTQRDLMEFARGNPTSKAKVNLVMRSIGIPEHEIAKFIGYGNVMSEEDAKLLLNPNRSLGKIDNWIEDAKQEIKPGDEIKFKSLAKGDRHTKGLTPERQVKNLKDHGTQFNLSDDTNFIFEVPSRKASLTKDDMDADFADLLDIQSFDIDASDDELLGIDVKEDSLEVFDKDVPLTDFEDERD